MPIPTRPTVVPPIDLEDLVSDLPEEVVLPELPEINVPALPEIPSIDYFG
jgi:hypothetical protein